MNSITGECLCGQITVSLTKEAFEATDKTLVCRCKNCRQSSGSLGSINIIVPESAVKITGQPKLYRDSNTTSGAPLQRAFCGNCGSPIYSASPNMPGIQAVKLGLFDKIPKPSAEQFCKARPSWDKPIADAHQFDTVPPKQS
ncbi:unnamed protein product [Rotaria sp. Silwood1]|nr:unnamed protein product [Rotaria sp. Silwood1]CAF3801785.1 unnamed protein product [Rotaria sp. Silwood1]CAF3809084.1 unnamed protein product [Rotaria sp. Silwood1]CAF3842619.1 unnamed protein product [Rotaria sp. Silwood1]CAF4718546.1 unnamed protein product [Rotaria sp. Silwood1]